MFGEHKLIGKQNSSSDFFVFNVAEIARLLHWTKWGKPWKGRALQWAINQWHMLTVTARVGKPSPEHQMILQSIWWETGLRSIVGAHMPETFKLLYELCVCVCHKNISERPIYWDLRRESNVFPLYLTLDVTYLRISPFWFSFVWHSLCVWTLHVENCSWVFGSCTT